MRFSSAACLFALAALEPGCTDPATSGPASSATASASAARTFPSSVGVLRAATRVGRPELPTATDRGCTEPPAPIDERRLLDKELGIPDPVAATPAVAAGFFFVREPAVVPSPGTTTIPGLFLSLEPGPRRPAGAPFSLRARWENRVDKPRVVMRPVHGSFSDWRAPSWHVMARDPATKRIYRYDHPDDPSCTGLGQIMNDDYVTIGGGTEAPTGVEWEYAAGKLPGGKLEVWLVYRFCGHADGTPFYGFSNEGDVLRDDVTKGLVASNAITIEL